MLDELGRFLGGEDITLVMLGAVLSGSLLLIVAWAAAAKPVARGACGLVGAAVLVAAAATQPHGWINVGGTVVGLTALLGAGIALARHQDRRDGRTPVSWRGGFATRQRRVPRTERRLARRIHEDRADELAIALGVEIALARITAGLDLLTLADRLGILVSRYNTIEEGDQCVSVADLERIADFHGTTVADLYTAARDRIARGALPTGPERTARHFERTFGGGGGDRYYTDHA